MKLFKSNWGQWTDLSTGAIHETRYLLQARRHKNGRVNFRVEKSESAWTCPQPTIEQLKEVVYLKSEINEIKQTTSETLILTQNDHKACKTFVTKQSNTTGAIKCDLCGAPSYQHY